MKSTNTQRQKIRDLFKVSKTSLLVMAAMGGSVSFSAVAAEDAQANAEDTEVINVTGIRSSIISAQEVKMNSNKIMDGISADDIGALPERSVTEALQRVPGVAIDRYMSMNDPEHFSVEGNGVIVRGLPQVRSELNGRSSFSAGGGRSLSFGDVPPELLSAVNVYKSPTADQIEGGLSGTVDLITKLPFHNDGQKFAFSLEANYGDMIEEVKPAYSAMYSNTWETNIGKLGFLADFAFSELSTRNDSMYVRPFFAYDNMPGHEGESVYVPRGADWRTMNFNRKRRGTYLAGQWQPAENHEITLTYFKSDYDMRWDEDAIFVSNDITQVSATADSVYNSNGVFESGRIESMGDNDIQMGSDIRVSTKNSTTEDLTLSYKYSNENWELDFAVQKIDASAKGIDSTVALSVWVPYIDVNLSGSLPTISSDNEFMSDPSNYVWDFLMDNQYNNKGELNAYEANAKYFLDDSGPIKSVKTGVRFTDSNSDNFDTGYNWGAVGNWIYTSGAIVSGATPSQSQMHLNQFDDFFGGDVEQPASLYAPNANLAAGFPGTYNDIKDSVTYVDWFDVNGTWQPRNLMDEQWFNSQEEKTSSVYVMADYGFDTDMPISGNFGVRYVKTENTAFGYLNYPTASIFASSPEPLIADYDYDNILPSFNMRVDITDDLVLRFAAAKAMARAAFTDLRSRLDLNADLNEAGNAKAERNQDKPDDEKEAFVPSDYDLNATAQGNPELDPMLSTQFDISLEWYYEQDSNMSFALFSKDIENYQSMSTVNEMYGPTGGQQYTYRVDRLVSDGEAKLRGAEFAVTHFFRELPTPFDGFGVQFNYTYMDSETDLRPSSTPVDTDGSSYGELPFIGISKNAYNLVGIYEKGDWSVRLAYNWRSKFLTSVGANGFNGSIDLDQGGHVVATSDDIVDTNWRLPVYNDDAGYLDGSIRYKLNDNLTLSLSANNLADTVTKSLVDQNGPGAFHGAYHKNDIRYSFGINGNF
ncbi:TonB-dependent receptor [Catenovulum sp. 2E275]|uniref:TonB-dependent receptor n=1 Tax=Catenovulum sp. 2E275 TaxID=2980497 RepID=UPI0021CFBB8F|nr:TonB-dependent receptor [Catenovulum sp. 2E275]MCU4677242.1 TonB-dependent receptor [Catenovulum sp. 2E275]